MVVCQPRFNTFAAAPLAGALFTAAALAQGTGRWTTGTPMSSSRTEIAVAEVAGKSMWSAASAASANSKFTIPAADRWSRGASY
jgi:hypothetical protein